MAQQVVLGLGAGQCGTKLLAEILNRQPGSRVTHEEPPLLPWQVDPAAGAIGERLKRFHRQRKERLVGDVASFYLPYLEEAIRLEPEIRILALRRPREEVVEAFERFFEAGPFAVNHWVREPGSRWCHDPLWSRVFPKYDTPDRAEAIRRYWDEYYRRVEELLQAYPKNLRLWDTEVLTSEQGVREVLSFAGVPTGDQVILTGRRQLPQDNPRPAPRPSLHPQDPRRCVIMVPFSGSILQECEDALKELERRGYRVWRVGGYAAIDQGRNQMATDAMLEGFEETMWIDADTGFHPDVVDRLRSHNLPIVGGVCAQKGKRAIACHILPGTPRMVFGKGGGLVEVLYAGTGFLLVRREAYLAIQRQLALPVCNERFGRPMIPWFQPMIRQIEEGTWYLAEDYAFCQRARQCGLGVWVDTSIRLWHIGQYRYGWEDAGLERQRFGSFTLNFSDAPGTVHETQTERPPALANLAAEYPWPARRPEPPPFPLHHSLDEATQALLASSITPTTRLVLDLGSWTGRSARYLATAAPAATILACDTWSGSDADRQDPAVAPLLPHLYDTFLAECWHYRDQMLPVRLSGLEALERIAETGLEPDLIHLAAQPTESALTQLVTTAIDLFPHATLVGHDLPNTPLCPVLEPLTQARHRPLQARLPAWRIPLAAG